MFFIHLGLLRNGLIEQFSIAYFVALLPLVLLQIKTLSTLFKLNERLLRAAPEEAVVPVAVSGR